MGGMFLATTAKDSQTTMGQKKQSHQQPSMPTLDFLTRQQQALKKIGEEPQEAKTKNAFKQGIRHNSVVMTRTTKQIGSTPMGDKTMTERKYNVLDESTKYIEESNHVSQVGQEDFAKLHATMNLP